VMAAFPPGYATVETGRVVETETVAHAAAEVAARRLAIETGAATR
jgi:dihydroorotase